MNVKGKEVVFTSKDGRAITLRQPRNSDLDALLTFANLLVKEKRTNRELMVGGFDRRITRKFESAFLRDALRGIREGTTVMVAAMDGSKQVGICGITRREHKDLHHTGVLGVTVLSGYRGVGIGEKLMAEALDMAAALGIWLVELEVVVTNADAVALYAKLGFWKAGVVPHKLVRDGRLYDMATMYADLRNR